MKLVVGMMGWAIVVSRAMAPVPRPILVIPIASRSLAVVSIPTLTCSLERISFAAQLLHVIVQANMAFQVSAIINCYMHILSSFQPRDTDLSILRAHGRKMSGANCGCSLGERT